MYKLTRADIQLLEAIIKTPAVSGNEYLLDAELLNVFSSQFKSWKVEIDQIGNVIAQLIIDPSKPTLLFSCHKDRIGFVVDEIHDWTARLVPVGGILTAKSSSKVLLYMPYKDKTGKITTRYMKGLLEIEIFTEALRRIPVFYANFGSDKAKELNDSAKIGDPVSFTSAFVVREHYITSAYLDDAVGVLLCLKLAEYFTKNEPTNVNLAISFTTQEEVGLRGIATVVKAIHPILTIMIDVTPTSKTLHKGDGPALVMADAGINISAQLRRKLEEIAKVNKLPLQFEVYGESGTSDWEYSVTEGYRTVPLGIPLDDIHSLQETVAIADLESLLSYIIKLKDDFEKLVT
jgi:putative aminopeptidase FrvX